MPDLTIASVEGLTGTEIHALDVWHLGLAMNLASELIKQITDLEIAADRRATDAKCALLDLSPDDRDGQDALRKLVLRAQHDVRVCKLRKQSMKVRVSAIQTTVRSLPS